jgi:hypothetical protein
VPIAGTTLAVAACNGQAPTGATGTAAITATGVVILVDGTSDTDVSGFTLRTAAGEILKFSVGRLDLSNGGLPAPHLRAHLLGGEPITVEYRVDGRLNVALRYGDASPLPTQ